MLPLLLSSLSPSSLLYAASRSLAHLVGLCRCVLQLLQLVTLGCQLILDLEHVLQRCLALLHCPHSLGHEQAVVLQGDLQQYGWHCMLTSALHPMVIPVCLAAVRTRFAAHLSASVFQAMLCLAWHMANAWQSAPRWLAL